MSVVTATVCGVPAPGSPEADRLSDVAVIAAPSNLGLRPPGPGRVPGCAKAPEALRRAGLHDRLGRFGAFDAGSVLPARYVDDGESAAGTRVRNQDALIDHARRLAERLTGLLDDGRVPLVLGGDCSLLVGAGLALARRGGHGLVHIDGHSDFRHPGNSDACMNLAGEDLAAVVGRHWPAVSDIDGRGPYFDAQRVAHLGCRGDDEHLGEIREVLGATVRADEIRADVDAAAERARDVAGDGYWLHLDVDVLDPAGLPAVDSPAAGGLDLGELTRLLAALVPGAVGVQVTVFDPDLDPDGRYARLLAGILEAALVPA